LGLKVVHPDDRELLKSVLRGDRPNGSTVTLRLIHKDGTVIWIEQKNVLVRDPDGRLVAIEGIARDITDRRTLEEQLQQAQRLEGVGRLAGGVAHDFNNLLTVINGYNQMALDDLPSDHPLRENLAEVRDASERAAALTQQLLAFSRKQLISPTVLNINESVVQIEKMLQRLIGEDVDLRTHLAPDLGNVLADSGQLQQVIMNLAVNSRDAMPGGGSLLIETRNVHVDGTYVTEYAEVRQGPYVMVGVTDSGVGMTREVQAQLFQPFFTTKPQGVGTGLGLATVYGIVKQAGGWIWVYSEVGRGSTFKIYLPIIDQPATPVQAIPKTDVRGTETILVVEDQADVRKLTVKALKKLGYKVHSASRPDEALALAQSFPEPIHLLLTDVVMPGMTGRDLADRMAKLLPGLPILFMSGYTDDAIVQYGVLDPGVAYIAKPFTADSLGQKVRETLGARLTPLPPAPQRTKRARI
jgi:signal transduction histidine kinase/ActR/RegA family two-component response regulator